MCVGVKRLKCIIIPGVCLCCGVVMNWLLWTACLVTIQRYTARNVRAYGIIKNVKVVEAARQSGKVTLIAIYDFTQECFASACAVNISLNRKMILNGQFGRILQTRLFSCLRLIKAVGGETAENVTHLFDYEDVYHICGHSVCEEQASRFVVEPGITQTRGSRANYKFTSLCEDDIDSLVALRCEQWIAIRRQEVLGQYCSLFSCGIASGVI
jgi:hypothetical protein